MGRQAKFSAPASPEASRDPNSRPKWEVVTLALLCGLLLVFGGREVRGQGARQEQPTTVTNLAVTAAGGENLAGVLVRTLAENLPAVAGQNGIPWDGRDEQGRLLPGGTYLCEVTASGEDGQGAVASRTLVVSR